MPPLSEAWATAYVQVLTMLIIFALGIPALAIQLVVQDDIRNVFQRRWRGTFWYVLVVVILLSIVAFVWVLHPPFRKPPENLSNVPKSIGSPVAQRSENDGVVTGARETQANNSDLYSEESSPEATIAGFLMTIIPVGLLILGFTYANYFRRQYIVSQLEKELIENFCDGQTPKSRLYRWSFRLRDLFLKKKQKKRQSRRKRHSSPRQTRRKSLRHLEEDTLEDLIYLGRNGKPGREKKLVLDALERIACQVQEDDSYQGDELEDLIRGLKEILLSGEQLGNDDNFNHVIEILKDIRYRLSQIVKTPKYIDAGLADAVLEELGLEAVKRKSGQIAERFLEEASSSSKIIFEMGLIALNNRQFHTAILALNKLETLAEEDKLLACSATFDLLGLLAHFSFSGTASCMRADSFLWESLSDFSPSIEHCLSQAFRSHYENGNFDTADKVFQLRKKITGKGWSPLLLQAAFSDAPPGPTRRHNPF